MKRTTLVPPQRAITDPNSHSPKSPQDQDTGAKPIPYTGSPLLLCLSDIALFWRNIWSIPGVLTPLHSPEGTPLDELYPSPQNIFTLGLHCFLLVFEGLFLISLPFTVLLPVWITLVYGGLVWVVVWGVSMVLNGDREMTSSIDLSHDHPHNDECWIFLNGVSIGHHWMHTNLDRLSLTFRRPILGVHNRTYGIIFDLIQCIVERCFCYATLDIRRSYAVIRAKLLDSDNKRVVLILHSQGGIEGSLILDWLLGELPHDIINKLEIYTFGSAANHFNNPPKHISSSSSSSSSSCSARNTNAVRHIEHYVNAGEFVARWGALTFARLPNRYMGRLFIRPGTGHLLNQHYLSAMFPLDEHNRVREYSEFMDMDVDFDADEADSNVRENYMETLLNDGEDIQGVAVVEDRRDGVRWLEDGEASGMRVSAFSRLWCYRNGMSPRD
ncbi:hypothetical protein P280DRAFT_494167 [Massarina eburnea CBS 473.64]|uniref:DUF676 domain-containing protein n=1 Tax=Massarina eburnea CBS 473.64 TaxID=1395130 RepID=A0A6A6RKY5_9PLEO|nr:hypothetical protein P280DRAFT_494167 [Massarina eburnea CBS 473.64]